MNKKKRVLEENPVYKFILKYKNKILIIKKGK